MNLSLEHILRQANKSPRMMLCIACMAMALPAAMTAWDAFHGSIGTNPLEIMIREPGKCSLILLLLALSIAPSRHLLVFIATRLNFRYGRRIPDWNWLVRLRRPVGLGCFFYATLHLFVYLWFDLDLNWDELQDDIRDKPFIAIGWIGFVLLVPLAITSTNGWVRRLKRNWKRLHMMIYPASILLEIHYVLLTKPGFNTPYLFAVILLCLMIYRVAQYWKHGLAKQERADGAVPERPPRLNPNATQSSNSS